MGESAGEGNIGGRGGRGHVGVGGYWRPLPWSLSGLPFFAHADLTD